MNPRRAPRARRPRTDPAFATALDDLRLAYRALTPAPDLVARVGAAIRAPRRQRRRAAFAVIVSVVTAFVGGYAMRGGPLPLGPDDHVGCVAAATHGGASPRRVVAPPATTRLATLLSGAVALPRPDAATRQAWTLATFDPDPRVREAATLLLALANDGAAAPDRRP